MKIGYFVKRFPYINSHSNVSEDYANWCLLDGGANVAYHLAMGIAKKKDHEINIFTVSADSKDLVENYENITIYRNGVNLIFRGSYISLKSFFKYPKCQIDILHAHAPSILSDIPALLYAKRNNIPFILTCHGDPDTAPGDLISKTAISFYDRYYLDKVLSYANTIICPSEHYIGESRFLEKYRNKIVVIPNGISFEDFNIPYSKEKCREKLELPFDKNLILFVGVLAQRKGPDVLIKAMPRVIREIPNTQLILVGSGVMRKELELLSNSLGVEKYVKFAGFAGKDIKPLYYKAADVFCLPSTMKTEVFPNVFLEASASGLPMVVSDLETFKCIIEDGYNGIVTNKGDENSLSDAIIYLLKNEDIKNKMSSNALERVNDFSWERIADETVKVYNNVLK